MDLTQLIESFQGINPIFILIALFLFRDQIATIFKPKPVDPVPAPGPTPVPVPVPAPTPDRPIVDVVVKQVLPILLPILIQLIQDQVKVKLSETEKVS